MKKKYFIPTKVDVIAALTLFVVVVISILVFPQYALLIIILGAGASVTIAGYIDQPKRIEGRKEEDEDK